MIEVWQAGEAVIDQAQRKYNGNDYCVNSFVTKSSGTWGGDKDLAKQVKENNVIF